MPRNRCGTLLGSLALVLSCAAGANAHQPQDNSRCADTGSGCRAGRPESAERETNASRAEGAGGVALAVPIGSVTIGPEFVGGERSFVRRVTMKAGVTVVELSATPFLDEGQAADGSGMTANPAALPAPW